MPFTPLPDVILRGCDFIDFSQKVALKTISLHAKKSRYLNKVTPSEGIRPGCSKDLNVKSW